ncbi:MAG: arginine-tRNA-protein transferase [Puniceicoccaceae bacterium 5H]|nr:MAG: arginine-tRNA-protein transferase [Puniceicoccaceae bacterium 5H]
MRFFAAEFVNNYATYSFGYCEYAEWEPGDDLEPIYTRGYLPYSGDPEQPRHLFYKCRSLRIDLARFAFDKKRRYHQRRLDELGPAFALHDKQAFLAQHQAQLEADALRWIDQRFDQAYLTTERLRYILDKPYLNRIAEVRLEGKVVAYALLVAWERGLHYWYSFYDSAIVTELSLGKWLMGHTLEYAQEQGLPYVYLGTAYRRKSAYKSQGTRGAEHFDGMAWNTDKERLKQLQLRDERLAIPEADLFKQDLDPEGL